MLVETDSENQPKRQIKTNRNHQISNTITSNYFYIQIEYHKLRAKLHLKLIQIQLKLSDLCQGEETLKFNMIMMLNYCLHRWNSIRMILKRRKS
jgi:hypothetical protein